MAAIAAGTALLVAIAGLLSAIHSVYSKLKVLKDATLDVLQDAAEVKQSELDGEVGAAQTPQRSSLSVKALARQLRDLGNRHAHQLREEQISAAEHKRRGQLLLDDLTRRFTALNDMEKVDWNAYFTQQIKLNEKVRKHIQEKSKLIIVASGKGGVGKSMLSLGLTESFVNENRHTLLVDFDLHNRGLTSLFSLAGEQASKTSVFQELTSFDKILLDTNTGQAKAKSDANDTPMDEAWKRRLKRGDALDHYTETEDRCVALVNAFKHNTSGMTRNFVNQLGPMPSNTDSVKLPKGNYNLNQGTVSFLPSLKLDERFLGSPAFEVDFVEIFFFFLALQSLAGECGYQRVVVDCHGAHDHLMVGAIHASSALIIVTTPEPGGFDGTYDLVAFAKTLQDAKLQQMKDKQGESLLTYLVLNNCRDFTEPAVHAVREFLKKSASDFKSPLVIDEVVQIPAQRGGSVVSSRYSFGDVAKQAEIWPQVEKIVQSLERKWAQDGGTRSDQATMVPESAK